MAASILEDSFVLPEKYKVFEELHDRQLSHVWAPPSQNMFSQDISHWHTMYIKSKIRIKAITYALSQSEPEVMANIDDLDTMLKNILPVESLKEMGIIFILLKFQNAMEGIHVRSYDRIDKVLELDPSIDFRTKFMPFIDSKVKCIGRWRGRDYMDKSVEERKKCLARALIGNVCAEGIVFNSLFSVLQYLRSQGILPGTTNVNEEIRIDEASHCISGKELYNMLVKYGFIEKLPQSEVFAIIDEFVRVDDIAIDYIFNDMDEKERELFLHMNAKNSKIYTRILANTILESLGYKPEYPYKISDNPYSFTNDSLIHSLDAFFDKQSANYGLDINYPVQYESDPEFD